jgi:hypothetical protein
MVPRLLAMLCYTVSVLYVFHLHQSRRFTRKSVVGNRYVRVLDGHYSTQDGDKEDNTEIVLIDFYCTLFSQPVQPCLDSSGIQVRPIVQRP